MDDNTAAEDTKGFLVLFVVAQFVGIILVIFTTMWSIGYRGGFAWTSDIDLMFNWHPFLMVLGMIYLQGSSILIYRGFRNARKTNLKYAHAGIHAVAIVFVLTAVVAVFQNHNLATPPKPNLYSLHSWVGGITWVSYVLQWVFSFVGYLYPRFSGTLRSLIMPYHIFYGHVIFVMGSASAVSGLTEKAIFTLGSKYGAFPSEGIVMNVIGVLVVIYAVLVVYLSTNVHYKRHPRPEDSMLLNHRTSSE